MWLLFDRAHLQPYLKDVFAQLQDLLVLNAPSHSTMNGQHLLISDNDQLFLYETASMLVVSSSLSPEVRDLFVCIHSIIHTF